MSTYQPYSSLPPPKPKPSHKEMDSSARTGIQMGVFCFGIMMLYSGFNSFVVMGTPEGANAFLLVWAMFAIIIGLCAGVSVILGLFLDLGSKPYFVMFGWLGMVIGAGMLLTFVSDMFFHFVIAAEEFSRTTGSSPGRGSFRFSSCFTLFISLGVGSFAISAIAGIESPRSWLYSFLLCINLSLCTVVAGVFIYMAGGIKTSDSSSGASEPNFELQLISTIGTFRPFTYTRLMAMVRHREEAEQAQEAKLQEERQKSISDAKAAQARAVQQELDALTPTQRILRQSSAGASGPQFADAFRTFLRDQPKLDRKDVHRAYDLLLQRASDKQLLLDLCIDERADDLAQLTYIAMLRESGFEHASQALIGSYLFKPGLADFASVLASYSANPSITRTKLQTASDADKTAFLKSAFEALTSNATDSQNLVPLILGIADAKTRKDLYSLALQPGTNEQAVHAIINDWLANSPETFQEYFRVYLKYKDNLSQASFDQDDLAILAKVPSPDPRIQEPLALAILESSRKNPTPQKLATLSRWTTPKTRRIMIDSLLAINSQTMLNGRDADFKVAASLDLSEPMDHIIQLAMKADWLSPAVLDYLRQGTLHVERSILAAMDKKENQVPECESEIRFLEQVGWRNSKQRFIQMYKFAKTPEERRRMAEAESAITRQIAQTIRTNPDTNPDKLKAQAAARPAPTETATTPEKSAQAAPEPAPPAQPPQAPPTPAQASQANQAKADTPTPTKSIANLDIDDVIQIKSLGNLEYAIVTGTGSELIPVTLINKANKKDFIPPDRIVQIVGKADDQALIKKLQAAGPTPISQPNPDKTDPSKPGANPGVPTKPIAGMRVEVRMFGDWQPAKVDRLHADQCYIIFDDKAVTDGWFGLQDIRPKGSKKSFLTLSTE